MHIIEALLPDVNVQTDLGKCLNFLIFLVLNLFSLCSVLYFSGYYFLLVGHYHFPVNGTSHFSQIIITECRDGYYLKCFNWEHWEIC